MFTLLMVLFILTIVSSLIFVNVNHAPVTLISFEGSYSLKCVLFFLFCDFIKQAYSFKFRIYLFKVDNGTPEQCVKSAQS